MVRMTLLAVCAALVCVSVSAVDPELVVTTPLGTLQGIYSDYEQSSVAFLGVPFANPPVGDLRWEPPQDVGAWTGVKMATEYSAGCIQDCTEPNSTCPYTISEDCLYLNVFRPRAQEGRIEASGYPVMVFFHGGNFKDGWGGGPLYDGQYIANTSNTILIGVNYRLGILGFMTSSDLDLGGNYGIQDQQSALRWVQKNIASFGGDPDRVTIFGQSAGSVSVAIHLYSPASKGLFAQAGLISEPYTIPLRYQSDADNLEAAFAKYIGCDATDLTCLRAQNTTAVLAAQAQIYTDLQIDKTKFLEAFMPIAPTIGGPIVPKIPYQALMDGDFPDMPIVMGNTAQEGTLFVYEAEPKPLSVLEYKVLLEVIVGNSTEVNTLWQMYPVPPGTNDTRPIASTLVTDGVFLCPNRNATRTIAAKQPIWYYLFDHPSSFASTVWGNNQQYCWDVSCHGSDLPFHFHQGAPHYYNWTADEAALSASMVVYWTNFAHTGDVNKSPSEAVTSRLPLYQTEAAQNLLNWPQYEASTSQSIHWATPSNYIDSFFDKSFCDVWDTIGYNLP